MEIQLDNVRFQRDFEKWSAWVFLKGRLWRNNSEDAMRVELQRLVGTLIRFMPPWDKNWTGDDIEKNVLRKFHNLEMVDIVDRKLKRATNKFGTGEVLWYAFNTHAIYGTKRKNDMREASVESLQEFYFKTEVTSKGAIIGQRGKQKVFIYQKVSARKSTIRRLIARLKMHVGRLKAGWLPAWQVLGRPMKFYSVPGYVLQHESGARGSAEDHLRDRTNLSFTLINRAEGAKHPRAHHAVQSALKTRSEAIPKRIITLMKYPEKKAEDI